MAVSLPLAAWASGRVKASPSRPELSEGYFKKALERLTERNPNPYHSETYYLLGLSLLYQGRDGEAYDAFYKASRSNGQQEKSCCFLAAIDSRRGSFLRALEHIERSLVRNSRSSLARSMKGYLLRRLGRDREALDWLSGNLALDPFDFVSAFELRHLCGGPGPGPLMRDFAESYLSAAISYACWGAYADAARVLELCGDPWPMVPYYRALYLSRSGVKDVSALLREAEGMSPDFCFPNRPEDIEVLCFAMANGAVKMAPYYLGCLYYDRLQYHEAVTLWEQCAQNLPDFPTVHRNLALGYMGLGDTENARRSLSEAALAEPSHMMCRVYSALLG